VLKVEHDLLCLPLIIPRAGRFLPERGFLGSMRDNEGMATLDQTSAGGVAFRPNSEDADGGWEVALIQVGPQGRWQLPKGLVNAGETPETAALREVAEEAGIETRLVAAIDVIEYWYYGSRGAQKVRFHKRVHFFLLQYVAGDVAQHDDEVEEARWVGLAAAKTMLTYASERKILEKAEALLIA
jgi:8-oxo-dGTP pyrophosphatase MutT (NUDIX family)